MEVEKLKVAEVAASYACSPANIYAILKKVRPAADASGPSGAEAPAGLPPAAESPVVPVPVPAAADPAGTDLFAGLLDDVAPRAPDAPGQAAPPARPVEAAGPALQEPARVSPLAARAPSGQAQPALPAAARPARAAVKAGKGAGVALLMRTAEGEENAHPFRSLEELLSAAKPILRSAARSPEPVWFSIQQVELDAFAAEDA